MEKHKIIQGKNLKESNERPDMYTYACLAPCTPPTAGNHIHGLGYMCGIQGARHSTILTRSVIKPLLQTVIRKQDQGNQRDVHMFLSMSCRLVGGTKLDLDGYAQGS